MKKTIILFLILISSLCYLNASFESQVTLGFIYSNDTNIFSNPLPTYDHTGTWLEWRSKNPFLTRHNIGMDVTYDMFFSQTARVGLSTHFAAHFPLKAQDILPIPENESQGFKGNWDYHYFDSTGNQKTSIWGALGPIFKVHLGIIDLGASVRLSLGVYDVKNEKIILGIQAEPFINIFMTEALYFNFHLTYDAHLIRFISDTNFIFDENYQMLTIAPTIGIGYKF